MKFVDPSPVVGLLQASLPFLAFNAFVYLLGTIEIVVAILLAIGIALPYAGLVTVGLFAGTLTNGKGVIKAFCEIAPLDTPVGAAANNGLAYAR